MSDEEITSSRKSINYRSRKDDASEKRKYPNLLEFLIVLVIFAGIGFILATRMGRMTDAQKRSFCKNSLDIIGRDIEMYQRDFGGQLPESVGALALYSTHISGNYLCSASDVVNRDWQPTLTDANKILNDPKYSSYIYCGDGLRSVDPIDQSIVIAFERAGNHGDGSFVLFMDGSVEFIKKKSNRAALDQMRKDAESGIRPVRLKRP